MYRCIDNKVCFGEDRIHTLKSQENITMIFEWRKVGKFCFKTTWVDIFATIVQNSEKAVINFVESSTSNGLGIIVPLTEMHYLIPITGLGNPSHSDEYTTFELSWKDCQYILRGSPKDIKILMDVIEFYDENHPKEVPARGTSERLSDVGQLDSYGKSNYNTNNVKLGQ